ncbi:hypothetical protein ACFLZ4_02220 [Patescibacteria group bacterium]
MSYDILYAVDVVLVTLIVFVIASIGNTDKISFKRRKLVGISNSSLIALGSCAVISVLVTSLACMRPPTVGLKLITEVLCYTAVFYAILFCLSVWYSKDKEK